MTVLDELTKTEVPYDFVDILSGLDELRKYLSLRDCHEVYSEILGTGRIGIPCFVLENGNVTLGLREVLKKR
jgi:glutaredoxin-related protein